MSEIRAVQWSDDGHSAEEAAQAAYEKEFRRLGEMPVGLRTPGVLLPMLGGRLTRLEVKPLTREGEPPIPHIPKFERTTTLTDTHQRYELSLLGILSQPGFRFNHPRATAVFRGTFGFTHTEWTNLVVALAGWRKRIMTLHKDDPEHKTRITGLGINPEKLFEHRHDPYVTPRVIGLFARESAIEET